MDVMWAFMVQDKLDQDGNFIWKERSAQDKPTFAGINKFLFNQADALRGNESNYRNNNFTSSPKTNKCVLCNENHYIYGCGVFADMTVQERWKIVQRHSLCPNGLRAGHQDNMCLIH
jgi:hypothetical protein